MRYIKNKMLICVILGLTNIIFTYNIKKLNSNTFKNEKVQSVKTTNLEQSSSIKYSELINLFYSNKNIVIKEYKVVTKGKEYDIVAQVDDLTDFYNFIESVKQIYGSLNIANIKIDNTETEKIKNIIYANIKF